MFISGTLLYNKKTFTNFPETISKVDNKDLCVIGEDVGDGDRGTRKDKLRLICRN